MRADQVHNGRCSYAGALCTIRYLGPLPKTNGDWLGVEWDDPSRGKHDGTHEGRRIFRCLSSSPTAASFLRPTRRPDPDRTLLEAIKFKYAPSTKIVRDAADGAIEISGKVVEEVGFERIQKQLSVLADLKIVLVDELVVSSVARQPASPEATQKAQHELQQTCPNIVELDLGWNVIETWQDVVDMCAPFQKMKILKAGGLRLREFSAEVRSAPALRNIEELHLNEGLFTPRQILEILFLGRECNFVSLKTLSLSLNELASLETDGDAEGRQCPSITTILLENNKFTDLSLLPQLFSLFPGLTTLSLQGNVISTLGLNPSISYPQLETLNIAGNQIPEYSFIDHLPALFPNLTSLRISRNPLYGQRRLGGGPESTDPTAGGVQHAQAPSAASDSTSYYLTLARLPALKSLNYTTITPREREEGEIYYLSVAEKEITSILEQQAVSSTDTPPAEEREKEKVALARQRHPLYSPLCAKYDREDILQRYLQLQQSTSSTAQHPARESQLDTYAPGTLGSRLVDAYIYISRPSLSPSASATASREPIQRPLPTTISVYRLKSLVARHFSLPALRFKLIYESHEYDPVEPIQSTRNIVAIGGGGVEEAWRDWGDWDVDDSDEEEGGGVTHDGPDAARHPDAEEGMTQPKFITREGHRFRKRETEILDGMRPWGDFLDVDVPGQKQRRDVTVRVEPYVAM